MILEWLGYPQMVLALWGPAVVVGLWWLARPLLLRLASPERFAVAVAVACTPLLALCVPYLPDSALREALPWRAPIAWGVSTGLYPIAPGGQLAGVMSLLLQLATMLCLLSPIASFALGLVRMAFAAHRIRALRPQLRDGLLVVDAHRAPPGFVACTIGLFRPRIVVSTAALAAPGADAIVEHERAHAAGRHPLWIFLGTCALRSWWWIPGRRAVLAEISRTAELSADARARARVGAPALARALRHHLPQPPGRGGPAAVPVGFADRETELVERVRALVAPMRGRSSQAIWTVRLGLSVCVLTVITLL